MLYKKRFTAKLIQRIMWKPVNHYFQCLIVPKYQVIREKPQRNENGKKANTFNIKIL